ncbi:MAG: copper amine oxidase N-terminal domain-containing protein [Defluviitaleaceae bacterium]|nr:copper amine oxidase N-terminal domain-containing protein [Defluviitaleaceae bacterium]
MAKTVAASLLFIIASLYSAFFAIPLFDAYAFEIYIEINGERLDVPPGEQPVIVDGRTLAPIRLIAEALGLSVDWDAQVQTVFLDASDSSVSVQIGSSEMFVNERVVSLDVPAQIISGRAMIPLRSIAEATGMDVIWSPDIFTIHILEPFSPVESWPEHLPEHIPGSVTLRSYIPGRHWSEGPMRFRHAFYWVPFEIINLIHYSEMGDWWDTVESYIDDDINQTMRFVQYFNISREDFDAALERMRSHGIRMGHDFSDELHELPNADIIFTFDDEIIRWFYRRE